MPDNRSLPDRKRPTESIEKVCIGSFTSGSSITTTVYVDHYPRPWWRCWDWRLVSWYGWFMLPRGGTGNVLARSRRELRRRTFEHIRFACDVPDYMGVTVIWRDDA